VVEGEIIDERGKRKGIDASQREGERKCGTEGKGRKISCNSFS